MNNWTIMAPHARVSIQGPRDLYDHLERVAGVKNKGGRWLVPFNAVGVVGELVNKHGATATAAWARPPTDEVDWPTVEARLRKSDEVKSWVLDGFLTEYQKDAIAFGWNKSGVAYWHSTGAGKTLTGIIAALSSPLLSTVVVVTRAASRLQYAREIERFLNVRAYVVRPASNSGPIRVKGESWNGFRARHKGQGLSTADMGKLWSAHQEKHGIDQAKPLSVYVHETQAKGTRPFVVVGWEALTNNLSSLLSMGPGAVIFDESHRGKSTKRWDVVHLPELPEEADERRESVQREAREAAGKGGFIKDTEDGRKMFLPLLNTASAAASLARRADKRLATTATPIKDRVRDLWAQLDMIEPNAWGNSTAWRKRYADMKPGKYGGMDDRGSSHLDELNERLRTVAHILSYSETHRHLPPKRRQSLYIAPEDLCRPTAGFAKELREAARRGPSALLEAKLAQAGSGKRKAVLGMIADHLNSKQKVVVFTGRRRDCEELGKAVARATEAKVWAAHGGQSTDFRQGVVDDYMSHPGPCILIGTGHAFGESLNIDDTDAAFFVMLPYTPGQLRQWEGRFHRASTKRPVVITYVIAEGTVDEHIASILIDKLPAVEEVTKDTELAEAGPILGGINPDESDEDFASSVLSFLDEE